MTTKAPGPGQLRVAQGPEPNYTNPPDTGPGTGVDTAPEQGKRCEREALGRSRGGVSTKLHLAAGKVTDACYQRHTNREFLHFLKLVAKAHPRRKLHVVCDNYATHKHPNIVAWLKKNPRITLHFTPTSGSWLNMVEIFTGIITPQAIRRGSVDSVHDLNDAIRAFIDGWNERCEPFIWTKDAETILAKTNRKPTSGTRQQQMREMAELTSTSSSMGRCRKT